MIKKSPTVKSEIVQETPERAPAGWVPVQDKLAAASGLSLLLVDGDQPPALAVSNNNSICHAFQSSPEFVKLCDPYCGAAHRRVQATGDAIEYKCHAGLTCFAAPITIAKRPNLAVIGGRAFLTGADYRATVERFRTGDLQALLPSEPFRNVIFSESDRLDELASRITRAAEKFTVAAKPVSTVNVTPTVPVVTSATSYDRQQVNAALSSATVELQREVETLRNELEHRSHFNESLQHFVERFSARDPQDTYAAILKNAKELLFSGRASLFVYNETTSELVAKAAIGLPVEVSEIGHVRLGDGIAGRTLETGKPFVIADIESSSFKSAPERGYKGKSFISYPIALGGRIIGVLNLTEKVDGGVYDDVDLSLIDIIAPQIATALERAGWQERAIEFQLMSITDPLTGLLNRRYLEERLNEELNRSRRYNYSLSFLMIDIDDFKNYNDVNGHQAGDQALQITAHWLKAGLRLEDVACRYGGEEFCILLPQTPIHEAVVIAERIRRKIVEAEYPYGKNQPLGSVTVSIGISTSSRYVDTSMAVIAAADRALYSAKSKGKNRIEIYQENLVPNDERR